MIDNQLEVEICETFEEIFNNYLCHFKVAGVIAYQQIYSNHEKDIIFEHMNINSDSISEFANIRGGDFRNLLFELGFIIESYNKKPEKEIQDEFKKFMRSYELVGIDYAAISRSKIKNKVKGIRNMRMRYEKNVYPKLEIFYGLLMEKVAIQGKWSSVNVAVREILPELKNRFLEYDRQEIISKIEKNRVYIEENKRLLRYGAEMDFKYYKRHHVKKQQNKLIEENCQLESILQSDDLSFILKNKIPFNTEYLDEVLMNNLRRNKRIMSLCIIDNGK